MSSCQNQNDVVAASIHPKSVRRGVFDMRLRVRKLGAMCIMNVLRTTDLVRRETDSDMRESGLTSNKAINTTLTYQVLYGISTCTN